jgi:hypothetical protein
VTGQSCHGPPQELVRGIAEIAVAKSKNLAFWLGIQEYNGIRGGAVVAFSAPGIEG